MSTSNEVAALRLALEALEELDGTKSYWWQEIHDSTLRKLGFVMEKLRLVIAEAEKQEQRSVSVGQPLGVEPGAFIEKSQFDLMLTKANLELVQKVDKLINAQQRTWVGLTDIEINDLVYSHDDFDGLWEFADAVEAKLKEKNT